MYVSVRIPTFLHFSFLENLRLNDLVESLRNILQADLLSRC